MASNSPRHPSGHREGSDFDFQDEQQQPNSNRKKEVSAVVRKLRFMRMKEDDFYEQKRRSEKERLNNEFEWSAPDWEDAQEIYNEQCKMRELKKNIAHGQDKQQNLRTTALKMHGRRSFGGFNPPIENFMLIIDRRLSGIKRPLNVLKSGEDAKPKKAEKMRKQMKGKRKAA